MVMHVDEIKTSQFQLESGDRVLDLSKPKIMGIINLTPDSFYDAGNALKNKEYMKLAEKMIEEGADIIDIGAVSTRPGAATIDEEEELKRLEEPLKDIIRNFPETFLSVDTWRSGIARKAIEAGAHLINDISGGTFDENMFHLIAEFKVPYVLMHIQGTPQTMQICPVYNDVVRELYLFFETRLKLLKDLDVMNNIILDPGFGFGKTIEHNYRLLHGLKTFSGLGFPLLAGVSRKSMITKVLKESPKHALNGTTVIHTIALLNGANILRVHDVKEAKETIRLFLEYRNNCSE
jgi:dihydropteroate synthase